MSPTRPKRPCAQPGCPALVNRGRCPVHARERERTRRPEWITRFYASTAWKKLRTLKRARDPLCEDCRDCGRVTLMAEVDHVVPLEQRPELGLVLENLRSLCHACHDVKTRRGA